MPVTPEEALRKLYEQEVPFDEVDPVKFGNYFNITPDSANQLISSFRDEKIPHYQKAAHNVVAAMYPSLYANVETPTPGVPGWGAQLGLGDPLSQARDIPEEHEAMMQGIREYSETVGKVVEKGTEAPWYERIGAEIMMLGSAIPQAAIVASAGEGAEVAKGFVEFPLEGISKASAVTETMVEYHPVALALKQLSPDQYKKLWGWMKRMRGKGFDVINKGLEAQGIHIEIPPNVAGSEAVNTLLNNGLSALGLSMDHKTPEEAYEEMWRQPLTTAVQMSLLGYGKVGAKIYKDVRGGKGAKEAGKEAEAAGPQEGAYEEGAGRLRVRDAERSRLEAEARAQAETQIPKDIEGIEKPYLQVEGIPEELQGLAAEALKNKTFEEFEANWLGEQKHGTYWHWTDDPNFKIDPQKGPTDMSSMAQAQMDKGALMITSNLPDWAAYGGKGEGRPYVALIDMSAVPAADYYQVRRGFGNEFFVRDPSKAKVTGVYSADKAFDIDAARDAVKPQSSQELKTFYEQVKRQSEYPDLVPQVKQPWEMTREEFGEWKASLRPAEEVPLDRAYRAAIGHEFEDLPTAMKQYAQDFSYQNPQMVRKFKDIAPNDNVVMYRAISADDPAGAIMPGDWVAIEKRYAIEHGASGYGDVGSKIVSSTAKADDIIWAGTDANEYFYAPKNLRDPAIKSTHEMVLRDALQEGKPVPSEVLAEYPDLVPQVVPEVTSNGRPVGLNVRENKVIREYSGIDELPVADRVTFEQALSEAKRGRFDDRALEIAEEAIRSKRPITDTEHAGMTLKALKLRDEYKINEKSINHYTNTGQTKSPFYYELVGKNQLIRDQISRLTEGSRMARRESARSMSIGRMMLKMEEFDVISITQQAQAAKGRRLTPKETERFEQYADRYRELEERMKEMEIKNDAILAERDRLQAEQIVEMERKKVTAERRRKTVKKIRDAEAYDDISVQVDALKDMGFRVNDITGVTAEAAYRIGRIGIRYIQLGFHDLPSIVAKLQEHMPQLKKRDIYQALNARDPNRQIKAQHETTRRVRDLKTQARLLTEIEKAEKGVFDTSRTPKQQSIAVRNLQKQLRELRSNAYNTGVHPKKLETAIHTINLLQDQLANHYRSLRKSQPTLSPEYAALRENITDLRNRMRVQDELFKLNDQLRRGEFEVKTPPPPKRVSPELERARIELKRARRDVNVAIEQMQPFSAKRGLHELFNTFRTMKATADMSAVLRQGLMLSLRRPKTAFDAFGRSVEAFFSQYKAEQIDMAIRAADHHYIREKSKLYLAELDAPKVNAREEMFMSRLVERVPVLKQITQASERHMVTYLNLMRSAAFDQFYVKFPNATHAELSAWANWINVCSGRGNLGQAAGAGVWLSTAFFAPRFAVSRVQVPWYFGKAMRGKESGPRVRWEVAKDMAATAVTGVMALELAHLAGADVGINPDSPDFGKIVWGNTRFDMWAGMQQPMRVFFRIVKAGGERVATGRLKKDIDPTELAFHFMRYKAAPAVNLPIEALRGKSVIGEEVTLPETARNALTFMIIDDVWEAYEDGDFWRAAVVATAAFLGVGANTYKKKKKR